MKVFEFLLFTEVLGNTLPSNFKLSIIHTNDVHAHFLESDAGGSPCHQHCYGGVARRSTAIKELRGSIDHENILLLDAGDQSQGTPWYVVYNGAAAAHYMRLLKYDAMAIGNHEFDNGVDGFVENFLGNITEEDGSTSFPILACNIDARDEPALAGRFGCSITVTFGDVKVGIIGYTTEETPDVSATGNLIFNDVIDVVNTESARLRNEGVDIVIGVGHYGYQEDLDMVSQVDLDVIIGGHSHTLLYGPDMDGLDAGDESKVKGDYPTVRMNNENNPVPICQAFEYGKYLGHIDINFTLKNNRLIIADASDFEGTPLLLDSTIGEDPEILAQLEKWRKPVDELSSRHIGETEILLEGDRTVVRRYESNLGNLVADAMVNSFKDTEYEVVLSLLNSGGIRGDIPIGDINYGNVLTVLPFGGTFDLVELRGEDLWTVFNLCVRAYESVSLRGEFLQVSGFRVWYSLENESGDRVTRLQAKCNACDDDYEDVAANKTYWVVMTDFTASGGDGFAVIPEKRITYIKGSNDAEVLVNEIQLRTPINEDNTVCEERIVIDGKVCGDEDASNTAPIDALISSLLFFLTLTML